MLPCAPRARYCKPPWANDDADVEAFRNAAEEVTQYARQSRDCAIAVLKASGYLDADGTVAAPYRSDDNNG